MVASMDMATDAQIGKANLVDWRKLGQGLHARYESDDFAAAARFILAVAEASNEADHHPRVSLDRGSVDLKLISDDAVYRDEQGGEHTVEWVTTRDLEMARRISEIARDRALRAHPESITTIEFASTPREPRRSRQSGRRC